MAIEISIVVRDNQDCLFIWLILKLISLEDIEIVSFKLDKVLKLTTWQLELISTLFDWYLNQKNANTNSTLLDLFIRIFTCVFSETISLPHKDKGMVCVHSHLWENIDYVVVVCFYLRGVVGELKLNQVLGYHRGSYFDCWIDLLAA